METNKNLTPDELKKLKRKQYYEANKEKINAKKKESSKLWYEANKEKLIKKQNDYYNSNKDKAKEYYEANKDKFDKEKIKQQKKQYYEANKEILLKKANERLKNRLKTDPIFKLKHNVRNLVRNAINGKGHKKLTKTEIILGCTFEDFKQHLESQFEDWMSWDNYGLYNGTPNYGWDIDHITPNSTAITENEVIKLNHYTNLKPLCSYTNRVLKKHKIQ